MKKSFEMVVLAVNQKWPVLLYGPAGAGKSALINKLARDSGNQGISFLFYPSFDLIEHLIIILFWFFFLISNNSINVIKLG